MAWSWLASTRPWARPVAMIQRQPSLGMEHLCLPEAGAGARTRHLPDQLQALGAELSHGNVHWAIVMGIFGSDGCNDADRPFRHGFRPLGTTINPDSDSP
jgi:hypothetical protein